MQKIIDKLNNCLFIVYFIGKKLAAASTGYNRNRQKKKEKRIHNAALLKFFLKFILKVD